MAIEHARRVAGAGIGAGALLLTAGALLGLGPAHRHVQPLPSPPRVQRQVVQPGDTLWALCERATGHPELWPRVWAMNPQLDNPHWIHAGDVVHFVPHGERDGHHGHGPTLVASAMEMPPDAATDAAPARSAPRVEVVNTAPLPSRQRVARALHVFAGMFVTPEEMTAAGRVAQAIPDKILLRPPDSLVVALPAAQTLRPGQRLMIFRTVREVRHPITEAAWGYMTEVTGIATVQAVADGSARAVLNTAVREVERGQLVTPLTEELLVSVSPVATPPGLRGVILAVEGDRATVGEQRLVFIDRGSRDGVARGHRFNVVAHGDALAAGDPPLAVRDVATLLVVEARARSATCLVTDALREVWPGDPVQSATEP